MDIKDVPIKYKGIFEKAKTSRAHAVHAFCLECCACQRVEVTKCTSPDCPLFPHRPYQDSSPGEDEAAVEKISAD